jgi:drug/metabolite transporter (DMT)-like permease
MTPRGWAAFAAVSVLWGIPYLFIKIAVDEVSPAFLSFARVALAAAVLLPFAWQAGALRGLRAHWRPLLAFAVVEISIPFPLVALGEQHISSSLAAILVAAVPLAVAVLAIRFDQSERVTGWRLAGLVVGLVGVVALFGIDVAGEPDELFGAACLLVVVLGYAAGPLIVKRYFGGLDPRGPVAVALAISTVILAPFAAASWPTAPLSDDVVSAILVLGLLSTAAAFVLQFILIREVGASRAMVITYVNPVIAVALGVILLDETLGVGAVLGLALILTGSWLSTRKDATAPPVLATMGARYARRRATSRRGLS